RCRERNPRHLSGLAGGHAAGRCRAIAGKRDGPARRRAWIWIRLHCPRLDSRRSRLHASDPWLDAESPIPPRATVVDAIGCVAGRNGASAADSRGARGRFFPAPRPCQPGHPFGKLLKKELRLQQMALLVAGMFLLVWISLWEVHRLQPEFSSAFIDVGTLLYVGLLSLVIGSVASAEERQLGTAEWPVLMPEAGWE